jgi:hypothetical protein
MKSYRARKRRDNRRFFLTCVAVVVLLALVIATNYPLISEYGVFWEWKIGRLQAIETIIHFWFGS